MIDLLRTEAAAGFRRLAGTRLTGTVPLAQAVLNTMLRQVRQVPPGFLVEVQAANRIVARYGVVRATAIIDEEVRLESGAPQIRLELASGVIAWTLSRSLRLAALRFDGRRVIVDLGALPGIGHYRPYFAHLQRVTLRTTPGQVHVDFDVAVT